MNSAFDAGMSALETQLDSGMDMQVSVRPSSLPLLLILGVGLVGAMFLWGADYPGVAGLMALALSFEALMGIRRQRHMPVAVCGQGMRWWLVSQDGEMVGPFWLDETTRHGKAWMTLCLKDADKRRHRLLLGRWNIAPEGWRLLKWRVLEQSQHLDKMT